MAATTLPPFPAGEQDTARVVDLAVERLHAAARRVHDTVDAQDPTSADLLHAVVGDLEKRAWLVGAEREGRSCPSGS